MHEFQLTAAQRYRLRELLHVSPTSRRYRRAVALLALDEGQTITDVAGLLGVTRQTIHNWVAAFQHDPGVRALDDDYGIGRPTLWTEELSTALRMALRLRPHDLGY